MGGVGRIRHTVFFLLLPVALLFPSVLPGLALGILARRAGLRFGDSFAHSAGARLPGGGVEPRLLQPGGESRQILAKISGQPAVRRSNGHENVAATVADTHLHPLLSVSGYLQFDFVRRRRAGGLIR